MEKGSSLLALISTQPRYWFTVKWVRATPNLKNAGETGHPRNWSTKKGNGQLSPSIDPPEGLAERSEAIKQGEKMSVVTFVVRFFAQVRLALRVSVLARSDLSYTATALIPFLHYNIAQNTALTKKIHRPTP